MELSPLSIGLDCDVGIVVEELDWDIWLMIIFLPIRKDGTEVMDVESSLG